VYVDPEGSIAFPDREPLQGLIGKIWLTKNKKDFAMRKLITALILSASLLSPFVYAAPVDINSASAEQIAAALKGVGPAKAKAIVDYREQFGPFTSVEQLAEVKGIGLATVEKNRDQILLEGGAASEQ